MAKVTYKKNKSGNVTVSDARNVVNNTRNGSSSINLAVQPRYDNNVDYQSKINDAVARGDYQSAAVFEQQRNAKIADMNKAGTNPNGYKASNNWQSYAPGSSSNTINTSPRAYKSTGKVNTNTSYRGSYLNVDLDTDYQSRINKALAEGDYYTAAQNEALRNAKINYLNSVNDNPNGYKITNNFIRSDTNNKRNGTSYDWIWSYDDLKNGRLPDNWTHANVQNIHYRRDLNDGTIYSKGGPYDWTPVGNRINPETGEWMFDNPELARQAAYSNYIGATGDTNPNALSQDYIDRIRLGTQNQYTRQTLRDHEREVAAQSYYNDRYNDRNDNDGWRMKGNALDLASYWLNNANLTPDQRQVLHTNSFETDPTVPDDYHVYGVRNYGDPYSTWLQDLYRQYQYRRR